MKCFTLSSSIMFLPEPARRPGDSLYPVTYPKPVPGMRLDPTDRALVFPGGKRIRASQELLKMDDPAVISRSGPHATVYRCDVKAGADGQLELVPEQDTSGALVFVDLLGEPGIKYESEDAEAVRVRFSEDSSGAQQEFVLLALQPFKPVTAVRSGKRWQRKGFRFSRLHYVKERLPILFDGHNISYDIKRA